MICHFLVVFSEGVLCYLVLAHPGRKRYLSFRLLASYLFAKDLSLFLLRVTGATSAYFYAYYLTAILESVLTIWVIMECFHEQFFPASILPPKISEYLVTFVAGITFVFFILGVTYPTRYPSIILSAARTSERTATGIECGLLWIAVFFARYLGIPWRKRLGGIVAGLLFQTSVATALLAIPPSHDNGTLVMLSGMVMMSVWIYAHLQPEPLLVKVETGNFCDLKKHMMSVAESYKDSRLQA